MDRIVCAANKYTFEFPQPGQEPEVEILVVAGVRHYDKIMHKQISVIDEYYWSCKTTEEQGFLDNRGTFLTREEALEVALAAKQVLIKTNPKHLLFSEDLY
jgi:hypothetical protein